MTEYNITVNGKKYRLNNSFKQSIVERATYEYEDNERFSCWWSVAKRENYDDDVWEELVHEEGDPILTIETHGVMVPWERLDKLEMEMDDVDDEAMGDRERIALLSDDKEFGRTHFSLLPQEYEDVPDPGGDDPDKIPTSFDEVDDSPEMVLWAPSHPDVEHTWAAGEAMTEFSSWVEWNIQKRADQPRPLKEKSTSHDSFESLCKIHECDKIAEVEPSHSPPQKTERQRHSEDSVPDKFEDGKYGGNNWRA